MDSREDIFDQDRGEREYYKGQSSLPPGTEVLLPVTKDGFEALLEIVCTNRNVPVDDASRMVIAGYVHHIENEKDTTSFEMLGKILHKSVSNATTWRIDQEIKTKRNAAIQAEALKLKEESEANGEAEPEEDHGNVTSINKPTLN